MEDVLDKVLDDNTETNQEQICSKKDENSNFLTLPASSEPGIPRMMFSFNINAGEGF